MTRFSTSNSELEGWYTATLEALVGAAWNRFDVAHQLFFDGLQVESVV